MSTLVYDGISGTVIGLIGIGVLLISLAVLDIVAGLAARLLAALLPSFGRAARMKSILGVMQEHHQRQ
jgi:hypothetical protein